MDRKSFMIGAAGSVAASLLPTTSRAATGRQRDFTQFCDLFYRQKRVRDAFVAQVAPEYIQHSAGMAQGREAAIIALEPMFSRPTFQIVPLRMLWDGNLASVILDVSVGPEVRAIVIDIYRFAGIRIVEHWDVKAELGTQQRAGYFDGFRN